MTRRTILTLTFLLAAGTLAARSPIPTGQYVCGGTAHEVRAVSDDSGTITYHIPVESIDPYLPQVEMLLSREEASRFAAGLARARKAWSRGCRTASRQPSLDSVRPAGIRLSTPSARFGVDGQWISATGGELTAELRIRDGRCALVITSDTLVTDFIDCDGYRLTFDSAEAFDSFAACLDPRTLDSLLLEMERIEALFD